MLSLAASRVVVLEKGGTPWWVPLAIGVATVIGAAFASYVATWWFKKRDIDGENARQAAALIDDAERAVSALGGYTMAVSTGGAPVVGLLQQARIRAQPLLDADVDDRFKAALAFALAFEEWQKKPDGSRAWLREAIANVREGLAPYLAAPPIIPWRKTKLDKLRSFPTLLDLQAIEGSAPDPAGVIDGLNIWRAASPDVVEP